jgi:hypothetical protein
MKGLWRRRWFWVSFGSSLLFASLVGAFFWFYLFQPFRNISDYRWIRAHTEKDCWAETRRSIERRGWTHDTSIDVGVYGNEEWVALLMEKIKQGEQLNRCWRGISHVGQMLRTMTNQGVDKTAEEWLIWWEANRHKSQKEWIREGFEECGIMLEHPLAKDDIVALLLVIGNREDQKWFRRYNALRWLRDSDFRPSSFQLSDLPSRNKDDVFAGLITFCRWVGESPKREAAGVLDLGMPVRDNLAGCVPGFVTVRFALVINALLVILFGSGITGLWLSTRRSGAGRTGGELSTGSIVKDILLGLLLAAMAASVPAIMLSFPNFTGRLGRGVMTDWLTRFWLMFY